MIISICNPENTQKHEKKSEKTKPKIYEKSLGNEHCFFIFLVANRITIQNYLYLCSQTINS